MYQRERIIIFCIVLLDYDALNGIASLLPILLLPAPIQSSSVTHFATHSNIWIGVSIAVYAIGQSVGASLWGKWSDRRGRKPILKITIVLNAIGLFIAYFSIIFQVLGGLLLGRLLSGLAAGNVAIAASVIADISTRNTKMIHYRLIQMAIGLGLIVGPTIISLCHDALSDNQAMQIPLLLFAILQCALLPVVIYFFRETNKHSQLVKMRVPMRMTRSMRWALTIWAIYIAGLMLFGQFLPSILQQKFLYNSDQIAHYLLIMGTVYVVCQFFLVKYLALFFSARTVVCCFLLCLMGSVLSFSMLTTTHHLWSVSMTYYMCLALLMPNLYTVTSDAADQNYQGYLMGKAMALQGIATVIVSLLGGIFLMVNVQFILITTAILFFLAWGLFLYKRGGAYALV
jgi:DHA1 family tetracycline resistance protein-like MFS transporter